MKEIVYKSIKTALIFGAIGAIVAFSMPAVMTGVAAMGITVGTEFTAAATTGAIFHLTGVFGLFGALVPGFESLFSLFFKDSPKEEAAKTVSLKESPDARQVNINIQQAPQQAQGQALIDVDAKFRQKIEADRAAAQLVPPAPAASV